MFFIKKHHGSHSEQGNAILAVMLLAGVSAAVAGNMSNMMTQSMQQVGHTRMEIEKNGIIEMLRENVDCRTTLGYVGHVPTLCSTTNPNEWKSIRLVGRDGGLIGGNAAKVNNGITGYRITEDWYVEARCRYLTTDPTNPDNGIKVRAAKLNNDGTGVVDRFVNKNMGFVSNRLLMDSANPQRPLLCREFFQAYNNCDINTLAFSVNSTALNDANGPLNCAQLANLNFKPNAIGNNHVAAANITTAKIANNSVTGGKIDNAAIASDRVGNTAVNAFALANEAVIQGKIGAGQVTSDRIAAGVVDPLQDIAPNSVDSRVIKNNSIDGNLIADGAVLAAALAEGSISSDKIASGTLIGNRLFVQAVTGDKIQDGTLNSLDVKNGEILNAHLGENSISNAAIASSVVGSGHIADGEIITRHIVDSAITGSLIKDKSISLAKLSDEGCQVGDTFKYRGGSWGCAKTMSVEFKKCAMGFFVRRAWNPTPPLDVNGSPLLNDPIYLQQLKDNMTVKYTSLSSPYDVESNAQASRNITNFMDPDVCTWKKAATTDADPDDWVGCNGVPNANGERWQLVACQKGDNMVVSSDLIRESIQTHHRAYFDKDIIPSNNRCVTNDPQAAMGWLSPHRPENVDYQDAIVAICAKVK